MRPLGTLLLLGTLLACRTPRTPHAPAGAADHRDVLALADSIFAAAGSRDVERFVGHFAPDGTLVYVLNTRPPVSRQALHDAFRALLQRQQHFSPEWGARRVQLLAPGVAMFTGQFRTSARDTSGAAWGAEGVVTFAARREASGWRVVNWHTSERRITP